MTNGNDKTEALPPHAQLIQMAMGNLVSRNGVRCGKDESGRSPGIRPQKRRGAGRRQPEPTHARFIDSCARWRTWGF